MDCRPKSWRSKAPNLARLTSERLAGNDKGGGFGCVGPAFKKSPGRNDDNDQRNGRQQIDMSGIVTTVADFPAHCLASLTRYQINAAVAPLFPARAQRAVRAH